MTKKGNFYYIELKSKIKSMTLCYCTQNINVFKKQFDDECELGTLGKNIDLNKNEYN